MKAKIKKVVKVKSRNLWNINPVTRVVDSKKKKYNRQKFKAACKDSDYKGVNKNG